VKVGGWPGNIASVTDVPFSGDTCHPYTMSLQDIEAFKIAWKAAVKRSLEAGVDLSATYCYRRVSIREAGFLGLMASIAFCLTITDAPW
jgi:hypothetical protein